MAFEIVSTNQTSGYEINDSDEVTILQGVTVSNSGTGIFYNDAGTANSMSVTVLGSIVAETRGIDFYSTLNISDALSSTSVVVGPTGTIVSRSVGIHFEDGSSNVIKNFGFVSSDTAQAVNMDTGLNNLVENHGTLSSLRSDAVRFSGTGLSMENTGTISGGTLGDGISGSGTATLTLNNTGTISGSAAIATGDGVDQIENSGLLDGQVFLNDGNDRFINIGTGVATDTVFGGVGNDTLTGGDLTDMLSGGTNDDLIRGGGGDDTLTGSSGTDTLGGGSGNDSINGGTDNDTISGNAGDDLLEGEDGDDLILGGDGNDSIDAGAGNDTVNGNAGDDTITGSGDSDLLRGGRDDDVIRGGGDEDTIRGDSGDDLIVGEAGRDNLFGGSGNDVFLFESLGDSGLGAARDRIYDFRSGEDTLDISQIVGPVISYIGSANFSGSGGREVRTVSVSNGTLVYLDTDGDGNRDSDIYLIGTASVTEGDFLL